MPTKPRFALYMQDKHPLDYELEIAEYAEARDLYDQREATALDLQAAESALSEARRSLIEAKFAVLRGEATAWLAAGSLADAALENFK